MIVKDLLMILATVEKRFPMRLLRCMFSLVLFIFEFLLSFVQDLYRKKEEAETKGMEGGNKE